MPTLVETLTTALADVQAALDQTNTEVPAPSVPEKDQVRVVVENVLTSEGWTPPATQIPVTDGNASDVPTE